MWDKIANPKPIKDTDVREDHVRVSSRATAKGPWIRVQIGKKSARLGSFNHDTHKVHILIGSKEEQGNVAICCDDETGVFLAKKKKDGTYEVSITAPAAAGKFETKFISFQNEATVIPSPKGPNYIMFPVSAEFLAR